MLRMVNDIIKAQDALKERYGDKGYERLIGKMKSKTTDLQVLSHIAKDKNQSPVVRLIAIASMGE